MRHRKTIFRCSLLVLLLLIPACAPKATIPLPVLEYGRIETSGNRILLIFLRGVGGASTDFEEYGLIKEVRSRNLPLDIVVPDAHFGYYQTETIVLRLKEDIVDPARARGYRQIWLAGFSIGGLGSLLYIREHPEDIDGVMLASPFMGWSWIREEIQLAGGIRNWQPEESQIADWQLLLWSFLHLYASNPEDYPPLYLGYGKNDYLIGTGPELLGEALEKSHVFSLPGGHDYPTFKAIWAEHLNRRENWLPSVP
jgi:pimeloyl-ACP methyl ester carboxylesterase